MNSYHMKSMPKADNKTVDHKGAENKHKQDKEGQQGYRNGITHKH